MTTPRKTNYSLPSIEITSKNWNTLYAILNDNMIYSIALLLEKPDLRIIEIGDLAQITIDNKSKEGNRCRFDLTTERSAASFWNLLGRIILKEYNVKCTDYSFFSDYFSFNYLMRNYFMKISTHADALKNAERFDLRSRSVTRYQTIIRNMIYKASNNIHAEIDRLIRLWDNILLLEKDFNPTYLISNSKFESKLFESARRTAKHIHLDYFAKECIQNINAIIVLYFISAEEQGWTIDYYNDDGTYNENVCSFFRVSYYSLMEKNILLDNELSTYISESRKNLFIDLFADKLSKGGYNDFLNKMDKKIKNDPTLSKMPIDDARFFIRYAFIEYAYKIIARFHEDHSSTLSTLHRYSC